MADVNTTISSELEKTIPFVASFGNTPFIHQLTPKSVHKKVKKTSKPRFRVDFELSGSYIQNGNLWTWKEGGTVGIKKGARAVQVLYYLGLPHTYFGAFVIKI